MKFKRQWQAPEDMVLRVKKRLRLRLEGHALMIAPPATAIEVEMDPVISRAGAGQRHRQRDQVHAARQPHRDPHGDGR
ncbi:MAG: hypothetical protein WDN72_04350 [Alphaproteobacteria bacterium]